MTVVRIPTQLRPLTAGASEVTVQGRTVAEVLVALILSKFVVVAPGRAANRSQLSDGMGTPFRAQPPRPWPVPG